jgi:hypothetical protein
MPAISIAEKDLMKSLGFSRYSVLGWSDGANSAALLAIKSALALSFSIMSSRV